VSPNHISVADKKALDVVYGQGTAAFDKPVFYDAFLGDKPSVFSTRDRQDHARRRRHVSQAFSYKALQEFLPYIHNVGLTFIQKLDAICEAGDEVDALLWFNFLAFDVLSDLTFGKPIGMLAQVSIYLFRHQATTKRS
jgi:benzoate 4-monooxygenase